MTLSDDFNLLAATLRRRLPPQEPLLVLTRITGFEEFDTRILEERDDDSMMTSRQPAPAAGFADLGIHTYYLSVSGNETPTASPHSSDAEWSVVVGQAQSGTPNEARQAFTGTSVGQSLSRGQLTNVASLQPDGSYLYSWNVTIDRYDRSWLVATSTGYLKVYWDEVYIEGDVTTGNVTERSRTPRTYEYNATPVGTFGDAATYADGPANPCIYATIRPADPVAGHSAIRQLLLDKVRWSAVPSYVPNVGDPNGFPS